VNKEHRFDGVVRGKPFFSVITPSWNQGEFLGACIESVLGQGDPGFEHLIFDNCSTDSTADVITRYPHLRCVSESDRGQSDALNKGFLAAKGEIICWLNSDDAYPEGLFKRLRELFADPSVDVIFGDVLQKNYDGSGDQIAPARFEKREDLVRWWSRDVKLHQPAIFFRRSVRENIGLLNEALHYTMDYEYWWRMSEQHRFQYVPEVLAIQHRQPKSKTIVAWPRVYEERERIFAPHYGMIDGGDPGAFERERRLAMAKNYLLLAWSAPPRSMGVWENILRALGEDPASLLTTSLLGLIPRAIRGHRHNG
jgi:glycosyltransferase involved in cell wall biosynthesis